ncbi:MAG: hypothetical protein COB29_08890 [Sulfitobacter sp.]|jgi:hypothetical protein|nr:hypothetical protein [Roseobacter sp.]MBV50666.1 hypothetical protein [Roseobacter sp.]PHR07396.1 MAG: hypothetical protein COB29_08890 [Sulfitobacter sp.]
MTHSKITRRGILGAGAAASIATVVQASEQDDPVTDVDTDGTDHRKLSLKDTKHIREYYRLARS